MHTRGLLPVTTTKYFAAFRVLKLCAVLCHAVLNSARFKDELLPHLENKKVEVYWADHRLAALWANSDAAKAEFPDYTYLVG
jgi:hypothetical protein